MQEAGGGFLDWLEARKAKRQENVRGVSAWQRRKSKIALARRSTENMQAVLCMDAGGIEAAADHLEGAPPTLEAHLKDLERFEEQKAGVGGDGALALLAGSLGDGRGSTAGGGGDHGKNGGAAVSKADRAKAFKAIGAGDVETLQTLLRGDPGIANAVNGDGLTCLDFAVAKRKRAPSARSAWPGRCPTARCWTPAPSRTAPAPSARSTSTWRTAKGCSRTITS